MTKKLYLYPVWIRLWHVLNALLFLILILTGISMQYANPDRGIVLISFKSAVSLHNIAAVILIINYMFYVTGNIASANGKYYKIEKKGFKKSLGIQLKYYYRGMFQGKDHPFPVTEEQKFNPLQKLSYVLAMYICLPILIISGLGLLFPEIVVGKVFGVSGLLLTDLLHVTMGFVLSVFMIIHIYTCTLGRKPGTLFRSMIDGYHEEH